MQKIISAILIAAFTFSLAPAPSALALRIEAPDASGIAGAIGEEVKASAGGWNEETASELVDGWEKLTEAQRRNNLTLLNKYTTPQRVRRTMQAFVENPLAIPADEAVISSHLPDTREEIINLSTTARRAERISYVNRGADKELLRNLGIVIAAGGEGSRMMLDLIEKGVITDAEGKYYEKFLLPIAPDGSGSLEQNLRVISFICEKFNVDIPVLIVVNAETEQRIKDFLTGKGLFGLNNIAMAVQDMEATLISSGNKIAVDKNGKAVFNPNGGGGVIKAMAKEVVKLKDAGKTETVNGFEWFEEYFGQFGIEDGRIVYLNSDMEIACKHIFGLAAAAKKHDAVVVSYDCPKDDIDPVTKEHTRNKPGAVAKVTTQDRKGGTHNRIIIVEYADRKNYAGLTESIQSKEAELDGHFQANSGLYVFSLSLLKARINEAPQRIQRGKLSKGVAGAVNKPEIYITDTVSYAARPIILQKAEKFLRPLKDLIRLRDKRADRSERARDMLRHIGVGVQGRPMIQFSQHFLYALNNIRYGISYAHDKVELSAAMLIRDNAGVSFDRDKIRVYRLRRRLPASKGKAGDDFLVFDGNPAQEIDYAEGSDLQKGIYMLPACAIELKPVDAQASGADAKLLLEFLGDVRNIGKNNAQIDALLKRPRPVRPIIVGAGKGTRFENSVRQHNETTGGSAPVVNKSVAIVDGVPAIRRVLDNVLRLSTVGIDVLKPIVVVSRDNQGQIKEALKGCDVEYVLQDPVCGTGDAVLCARQAIGDFKGDALVIWSTMAVVRPQTLETAIKIHQSIPDCAMVYPAAWKKNPYAPLAVEGARVVGSRETHLQGVKTPGYGLDNIGAFIVKAEELFGLLERYRRENFNPRTGEYNGLPNGELGFPNTMGDDLPGAGKLVVAAPVADPRECQGIKIYEDAIIAAKYISEISAASAIGETVIEPHRYDSFFDEIVRKDTFNLHHQTTIIMLATLERYFSAHSSHNLDILDMGCGPGTLSIFAAQKSPHSVTAIDNDRDAVKCSRQNIQNFGLTNKIELSLGNLFDGLSGRRFHLALFNIPGWPERLGVTCNFFEGLARHLTQDGVAIVTWPVSFQSDPGSEPIDEETLIEFAARYNLEAVRVLEFKGYRSYYITFRKTFGSAIGAGDAGASIVMDALVEIIGGDPGKPIAQRLNAPDIKEAQRLIDTAARSICALATQKNRAITTTKQALSFITEFFGCVNIIVATGRGTRVGTEVPKQIIRADSVNTILRQAREGAHLFSDEDIVVVSPFIAQQLLAAGKRIKLADRKRIVLSITDKLPVVLEKTLAGWQSDYAAVSAQIVIAVRRIIYKNLRMTQDIPAVLSGIKDILDEMVVSEADKEIVVDYILDEISTLVLSALVGNGNYIDNENVNDLIGSNSIVTVAPSTGPGGAFKAGLEKLAGLGRRPRFVMPVYSDYATATLDTFPKIYKLAWLKAVGQSDNGVKLVVGAKEAANGIEDRGIIQVKKAHPVKITEWQDIPQKKQGAIARSYFRAAERGYGYPLVNAAIFVFDYEWVMQNLNKWFNSHDYDHSDRSKKKLHEYRYTDFVDMAYRQGRSARVILIGARAPFGIKTAARLEAYRRMRMEMIKRHLSALGVTVEDGAVVVLSSPNADLDIERDLPDMVGDKGITVRGYVHLQKGCRIGHNAILDGKESGLTVEAGRVIEDNAIVGTVNAHTASLLRFFASKGLMNGAGADARSQEARLMDILYPAAAQDAAPSSQVKVLFPKEPVPGAFTQGELFGLPDWDKLITWRTNTLLYNELLELGKSQAAKEGLTEQGQIGEYAKGFADRNMEMVKPLVINLLYARLLTTGRPLQYYLTNNQLNNAIRRIVKTALFGHPNAPEANPYEIASRAANNLAIATELARTGLPADLRTRCVEAIGAGIVDFANPSAHDEFSRRGMEFAREHFQRMSSFPLVIDSWNEYSGSMLKAQKPFTEVYLPDNNGEVVFDLLFIQDKLKVNRNLVVHLVAKDGQFAEDASWEDIEEILSEDEAKPLDDQIFRPLRALLGVRFFLPHCGPKTQGFDGNRMSVELAGLLLRCDVVFAKGQANFETLRGINKPTYFGFIVKGATLQTITGIESGLDKFVLLKVEPGDYAFDNYAAKATRTSSEISRLLPLSGAGQSYMIAGFTAVEYAFTAAAAGAIDENDPAGKMKRTLSPEGRYALILHPDPASGDAAGIVGKLVTDLGFAQDNIVFAASIGEAEQYIDAYKIVLVVNRLGTEVINEINRLLPNFEFEGEIGVTREAAAAGKQLGSWL